MMQVLQQPAILPHRDFVFWLQGFFEIAALETLTAEQVKVIKEHLAMCFEHALPTPTLQQSGTNLYNVSNQHADFTAQKTIAIC